MAEQNTSAAFATLRRFVRNASTASAPGPAAPTRAPDQTGRAAQEQCDLCGEPTAPDHRHLVDVSRREIKCVCQACTILFNREAASQGKYLLVPERRLYLADFALSEAQWERMRIPVGLAFCFHSTPAGRCVAFYPSPMGPTESLLELDTWVELERANPVLQGMQRDVEALLIHRARGAHEHYLMPIDECYRLVGLIRVHWRGLSGGQAVWDEIERFFAELRQRAVAVRREGDGA